MSKESKQSSPIGDVDYLEFLRTERNNFAKVIQRYFPHEGKPPSQKDSERWTAVRVAAEDMLICFDQMRERIAGSQWASSAHPSKEVLSLALNFLIDYYESKKNKPLRLANVIVELQQIVINQLDETPAHPTAEFCEGEDDIAFDFHKANEHPTAVNGDEKFFCRYEYDGNERCETVCGLCSQVKPKAAAPKADVKSKEERIEVLKQLIQKHTGCQWHTAEKAAYHLYDAELEYANQFKSQQAT